MKTTAKKFTAIVLSLISLFMLACPAFAADSEDYDVIVTVPEVIAFDENANEYDNVFQISVSVPDLNRYEKVSIYVDYNTDIIINPIATAMPIGITSESSIPTKTGMSFNVRWTSDNPADRPDGYGYSVSCICTVAAPGDADFSAKATAVNKSGKEEQLNVKFDKGCNKIVNKSELTYIELEENVDYWHDVMFCDIGTTVKALRDKIKTKNIIVADEKGNILDYDAAVATGTIVYTDYKGYKADKYTVSVHLDVDCDGKVTASDARLALRYAAKLEEPATPQQLYAANYYGKVTAADARAILRAAAHLLSYGDIKEVPVSAEKTGEAFINRTKFDAEKIMTGDSGSTSEKYNFNTYVFKGKIVGMKEYDFSWIDEQNGNWGPFRRSVLEVEVTKEYGGKSPVEGKTIKVLYPHSLAVLERDSVSIDKDSEYVFTNCWVMDEKYYSYEKANYGRKYCSVLKELNADVIMGGAWCSLFPVENNMIYAYHEFFDNYEGAKDIIVNATAATSKLTNPDALASGDYIALDGAKFDDMFIDFVKSFSDKK